MSERQPELFPMSEMEIIQVLYDALEKHGEHGMYCRWTGTYYDPRLPCTCGLDDALAKAQEYLMRSGGER